MRRLLLPLLLAVALILHRRLHALGFLRTLYFLPSVTSFVAIALVWMWIYHPEYGVINTVLRVADTSSICGSRACISARALFQ